MLTCRVVLCTVNPSYRNSLLSLLTLGAAVATSAAWADPIAATQSLREGGCGGTLPPARALRHVVSLDRAAEQWATGHSLTAAAERSGYEAQAASGLRISGPDSASIQLLKQAGCGTIANPALHDIGIYRHGSVTWLVLASASLVPSSSQAPILTSRALQLVNEVRARGARCGERSFGPAPPVKLSGALAGVAFGHADDMARHDYFEHEDLTGHSPADRVRASGYQEKLVGENIAYGPKSADEVVQGWLDSPGHCENIMDPRFAEMGIAYAAGKSSKRGLFWVQLLVAPKV
jgi:uncharacterized protein YkwD